MTKDNSIRDKLIDIILKVAMAHHDDISKSDEDVACDAVDEILTTFPQIQLPLGFVDKDGDCYYCGKKTNSLAMSPNEWCVFLCHSDDPGKVKHHHTGCVMRRLNEYEKLKTLLSTERGEAIKFVEYLKETYNKLNQLFRKKK